MPPEHMYKLHVIIKLQTSTTNELCKGAWLKCRTGASRDQWKSVYVCVCVCVSLSLLSSYSGSHFESPLIPQSRLSAGVSVTAERRGIGASWRVPDRKWCWSPAAPPVSAWGWPWCWPRMNRSAIMVSVWQTDRQRVHVFSLFLTVLKTNTLLNKIFMVIGLLLFEWYFFPSFLKILLKMSFLLALFAHMMLTSWLDCRVLQTPHDYVA